LWDNSHYSVKKRKTLYSLTTHGLVKLEKGKKVELREDHLKAR